MGFMGKSFPDFHLALVLGGARSGKSRLALRLGEELAPPRLFLATAEPGDAEMAARIAQHRQDRGDGWDTWEVPLELAAALDEAQGRYRIILVDCLTLWISNLLAGEPSDSDLAKAFQGLLQAADRSRTPLIFVSNEVGWGIVPDNPLARRFRDVSGMLNQDLAAAADLVLATVAGLPLVLKSSVEKGIWHGT